MTKRKASEGPSEREEQSEESEESEEEQVQAKVPRTQSERDSSKRVIVILEQATLETVKTSKGFELLNCDDHRGLHRRMDRDPVNSRPDITHMELLALFDSPLNKAGLLQVYICTCKNVLIEIDPRTRIPRTYKRFAGLIVQLLHKLKIRAANTSGTLLKVIKGPITRHLPVNCRKYGMSVVGELKDAFDWVPKLPQDQPVVFAIGAIANGHLDSQNTNYVDEFVSVSQYPLSGAQAVSRLLNAFEHHWGII